MLLPLDPLERLRQADPTPSIAPPGLLDELMGMIPVAPAAPVVPEMPATIDPIVSIAREPTIVERGRGGLDELLWPGLEPESPPSSPGDLDPLFWPLGVPRGAGYNQDSWWELGRYFENELDLPRGESNLSVGSLARTLLDRAYLDRAFAGFQKAPPSYFFVTFKELCRILRDELYEVAGFGGSFKRMFVPEPTPRYLDSSQKFISPSRHDDVQWDRPDQPAYGAREGLKDLLNQGVKMDLAKQAVIDVSSTQSGGNYLNPNFFFADRDLSHILEDMIQLFGYTYADHLRPESGSKGWLDPVTIDEAGTIEAILKDRGFDGLSTEDIRFAMGFFDVPHVTIGDLWTFSFGELRAIDALVDAVRAAGRSLVDRAQVDEATAFGIIRDLYRRGGVHPDQIPTMTINQINSVLMQHGIRPLLIPLSTSPEWTQGLTDEDIILAILLDRGIQATEHEVDLVLVMYNYNPTYEDLANVTRLQIDDLLSPAYEKISVTAQQRGVGFVLGVLKNVILDHAERNPILRFEAVEHFINMYPSLTLEEIESMRLEDLEHLWNVILPAWKYE